MTSRPSIIVDRGGCGQDRRRQWLFVALLIACVGPAVAFGQRIAIITPDNSATDIRYVTALVHGFRSPVKVLDLGLSDAAFRSVASQGPPYNMTIGEARAMANVVGCEYCVLVRTAVQRRTSFSRPKYFESFAVIFVVSGRTGELVTWHLKSFETDDPSSADKALIDSAAETASEVSGKLRSTATTENRDTRAVPIEEVPADGSPAAANLKTPVPYKRIKPEYTQTAFLYSVEATVEIEADINADGTVGSTRIVRWAGFGLETSVEKAVRSMNWRPAMRGDRPLPMRVLLRYNFTKIDRDQY